MSLVTTRFTAAGLAVVGDEPVVPVGCDLFDDALAGDTDDELPEADAFVVVPAEDGCVPELVEQPARVTAPATATARASGLFFPLGTVWRRKAPWAAVVTPAARAASLDMGLASG
jgi:hypothetical protein